MVSTVLLLLICHMLLSYSLPCLLFLKCLPNLLTHSKGGTWEHPQSVHVPSACFAGTDPLQQGAQETNILSSWHTVMPLPHLLLNKPAMCPLLRMQETRYQRLH